MKETKEIKIKGFVVNGNSEFVLTGDDGVTYRAIGMSLLSGNQFSLLDPVKFEKNATTSTYHITMEGDDTVYILNVNGDLDILEIFKSRSDFKVIKQ